MTDRRTLLAPGYAQIVLDNLGRAYPYASHHVASNDADSRRSPRELHPAFATSFDWHSCVHMHWLGVSLLEFGLGEQSSAPLRAALGANLTPEKLAVEVEYLRAHPGWERPYGWAWLVRLAAVCVASDDAGIRGWGEALRPAADAVAELVSGWVEHAEWPVRHGVHTNSAFGLGMLLDAFRDLGHASGAATCETAAIRWFGSDAALDHAGERSGQDFLSASLSEADLMRRVLPAADFAAAFEALLPDVNADSLVLTPAVVLDETDGYQVHLHGLNLSRAGQVARIAAELGDTPVAAVLRRSHGRLLEAGLAAVVTREYQSSHWLASFAWDAMRPVGTGAESRG
ncbi:DUF2891 family protein [Leifsonia sp. NPDC058230]|uniref:DUF2891 family protein n=1 Tax=Leifsonia sp. NPDC058230 TaxID=3346391 RepID=UPI0036DB64D7